jgi:hypothetical protein
MFRNSATTSEPAPVVVAPADAPIPLSHLALDLPEPVGGWPACLAGRGIEVIDDDPLRCQDAFR